MKLRNNFLIVASAVISFGAIVSLNSTKANTVNAEVGDVFDFRSMFSSSLGSQSNLPGWFTPDLNNGTNLFSIEAINLNEFNNRDGQGVFLADSNGKLPSWDEGNHWTTANKSLYTWCMWHASSGDGYFNHHPEGWRMTKYEDYYNWTTYPPEDGKCTAGAQYLNYTASTGKLHPGVNCGVVIYFTAPKEGVIHLEDKLYVENGNSDGTKFCIYKIPAAEFKVNEQWNSSPIHGLFGGSPIYPSKGVSPTSDWNTGWQSIEPLKTFKYSTDNISVIKGDVIAFIFGSGPDNSFDLTTTNLKVVYGNRPDVIKLNTDSVSVSIGNNYTLTPTIDPVSSATKSILWESSNPTVATVNNGVVTPIAVGNTTITATLVDGSPFIGETSVSTSCNINVVAGDSIKITNPSSDYSIEQGYERTLNYKITPDSSSTKPVTWSVTSGDDKVSVTQDGVITAIKPGSATVKVQIDGSSISDSKTITVTNPASPIVNLSTTSVTIEANSSTNVETSVASKYYESHEIYIEETDPNIATATWSKENGITVTGVAAGVTTIKAYVLPEYKTTLNVIVKKSPVRIRQWSKEFSPIESKVWKYYMYHDGIFDGNVAPFTGAWGFDYETKATVQGTAYYDIDRSETSPTYYFSIFNGSCVHPVIGYAAVVSFIAPNDGILDFSSHFISQAGGSTQKIQIIKNNDKIYPTDGDWKQVSQSNPVNLLLEDLVVSKGDQFYVIVDCDGDMANDYCFIDPTFSYTTFVPNPDVVILDKTEVNMKTGEYVILSATVEPEESKYAQITWTSSDNTLATVNAYGEIAALKEGTVTITASVASGASASCVVTITKGEAPEPEPSGGLSTTQLITIIAVSVGVAAILTAAIIVVVKTKKKK